MILVLLASLICGCGDDQGGASGSGPAPAGTAAAPLEPARYLTGHTDGVRAVAFSPDGKHVLTASQDGTARVWDAASAEELLRLEGHAGAVIGAAYSDDGERVATCGTDSNVMVWDAGNGELLAILEGHPFIVMDVAFAPDGSVISAGQEGSVRRWDVGEEQAVWAVRADPKVSACLAVSPDGTLLATGGGSAHVVVWDLGSGKPLWREKLPKSDEEESQLRARQQREAGGPGGGGGAAPPPVAAEPDPGSVQHVVFSPDGSRVYAQRFGGPVHEWDAKTGRHVRHLEPYSPTMALDVSPDGKWLFVASRDGPHVWKADASPMQLVADLPFDGHLATHDVAFSPDGRTVALAYGGAWGPKMSVQPAGETRVPLWDLGRFNPVPSKPAPATATAGRP